MSQFTLSLFDPNTLLYHRAGLAGLASLLSVLNSEDAPLKWTLSEHTITLSWECSDQDAVEWLRQKAYQLSDEGYIDTPALNLDEQGKYTFSRGILSTFLQHSQQRKLEKQEKVISFSIDETQPEIQVTFKPINDCFYAKPLKEAFAKGKFKTTIKIKSNFLPGLIGFIDGEYEESPDYFLALLFLPLACGYYQLSSRRFALIIPEVKNLLKWVKQRQEYSGRSYHNFSCNSAGESALRFLWQEKLLDDSQRYGIDYCEVYQLGKQSWNVNQSYIKQAVYRVKANDQTLEFYNDYASQYFPPRIKEKKAEKTKEGEIKPKNWLATSDALGWIADNLIVEKVWYTGFYEYRKNKEIYPHEREGLIKMTNHLTSEEQILFDAVQGAFRTYLRNQNAQAQNQGRKLEYEQVSKKVLYRLQRPNTQQQFATALVYFLSQYPNKKLGSVGPQIYAWLHRQRNWRQARDLTLLAIVTYTSQKKENTDSELVTEDESESESFSMDLSN